MNKVKKNVKVNSKKRHVQMKLSMGQKIETTCKECGMQYSITDQYDCKIHSKYHSRIYEGIDWTYRLSRIVRTTDNGYIIHVDGTSSHAEKKTVEELLELVNSELNAPKANDYWKSGTQGAAFVYINKKNKKAIGLLIVERISKGQWLDIESGEFITPSDDTTPPPPDPVMGISRIYTVRNSRRGKIATELLKSSANNFIYGVTLEKKSQIAWSQPTNLGGKLAGVWSGVHFDDGRRVKVLSYVE